MEKERADEEAPARTRIYSLDHSKPGLTEFQSRDVKLFNDSFWLPIAKQLIGPFDWQDALILTRFDYWITISLKMYNRPYFYKTYEEMRIQDFPIWEEYTIQTRILDLEKRGFIIPMGNNVTKWYYLDYLKIRAKVQKYHGENQ